jgi:broad-specificity NMP kinase
MRAMGKDGGVRAALVLVSGAPGVGKTTLARILEGYLCMVLLSKV